MNASARFHAMRHAAVMLLLLLGTASAFAADAVDVLVDGVEEPLHRNVLLHLSIEQQKNDPDLTLGRIRALHARAPNEIRAALQPFGYYRPQIEAKLVRQDDSWRAHYRIKPGPQMTITTLDLRISGDGATDPEFARLRADAPIKQGGPLNHAQYENTKSALQNLAVERGYFDAQMPRHDLHIDLDAYTSKIVLHFDTGPRYRFGPVSFEHMEALREDLLRRYVPFKPGEPFSNTKLLVFQRALNDSDYFQQVEVRPRHDLAEGLEVPVEVRQTLRKPDKYSLGLGYGTDTGMRGKVAWERRIVNEAGHRFGAEVNVSEIKSAVLARYLVPVGDPRTDKLAFTASWVDDHPEASDSQTATVGASLTQARGRWRETWSLNYLKEKFRAGSDVGRSTLLVPGASWLLMRTDDPIVTHRGYRLQFDLRGAAEGFASDVSFLQARLSGKAIHPVSDSGRLIARADAGATSVRHFDDLPASLRFYAGGDRSVRGYDYNTIGSTDALGVVIGGKYLVVGSLEYEQRLYEKWSGAVFYDIGNAFNSSSEPYREGAGLGLRWRSPIGLVRVDMAWALDLPDRPWRFHIVIGPDL
jgi:translocation and assembly module TamA